MNLELKQRRMRKRWANLKPPVRPRYRGPYSVWPPSKNGTIPFGFTCDCVRAGQVKPCECWKKSNEELVADGGPGIFKITPEPELKPLHYKTIRALGLAYKRPEESGYVYILRSENGLYKIGKAIDPASRHRDISNMSPVPLFIHAIYRVDYRHLAESSLHRLFARKRKHGEWFELSVHDLARCATRIRREMMLKDERLFRLHVDSKLQHAHLYAGSDESECEWCGLQKTDDVHDLKVAQLVAEIAA